MMYRTSNDVINDNKHSRNDSYPQPSESASAYHRRPVPSYCAESTNPSFPEPMGIIQSSQYTYATNPIPSPLYSSPVEPSSSQPQQCFYQHNHLMAAVLLPTTCLLLMNHPSSVPTISILLISLIIYALDLIRSRDGVVCTTWLAVPLLSFLMGWSWLIRGEDDISDTTDENGWTFSRSLFQTGAVAFFWALLAVWGTLQFQDWLTAYPTMARQMETCLHATAPLILASFLSHSGVQYLTANYGPDAAATFAPHIFAVLLWVGLITVGSCQASFSTQRGDEANKSTEKLREQSFIVPNNVALFQVLVLLLVPPFMHFITFWRRLLSRMADFDDWFDWLLSLAIPYLLMVSMKVLSKQKVAETPYASLPLIRHSGALPLGIVFLVSLALQQRYLIPFVHDFSYHYTGIKQSSWMFCFYWTSATIALLMTTWLWGRTSQGQPFLGEYHEDVLQLLLSLLGLLLGKGVGMPWNFAPLPILAFLGLSLWFSTRLLRYLGIVLFVFLASAFVIFTYRFAGIDHTLTLPFPVKNVNLIRFGMMVVASSALIGLVTGLAIRAPGGLLSNHLKRLDLTGILLVAYALVLMEMEIALIKRESTWAKIIGVHMVQDATVSDAMYTPELAYLTGVTLVGVSRTMKNFGMIQSSSSWIAIAFSVGKSFAIFIDKVHYEQDMHPLSPTDTLFDAILSGIAFLIMTVPHVFLTPVHVKASTRYQRNISGGPVLLAKHRRIVLLYACILLPLAIFLAAFAVMEPLLAILLDNNKTMPVTGCTVLVLGACACMWGVSLLSMLNHYLPDGGGEWWKKVSGFVFLLGVLICFTFPMFNSGVETARSSSRNPYKLAAASTIGRDLMNRTRSRTGGWGVLSSLVATLLAVAGPLELKERRNRSGTKDQSLLFRTTLFSLLFGGGVAWFVTVQLMNESDVLPLVFTTISSMMIAFLCTVTSVLGYHIELENFGDVEQLANTVLISFVVFSLTAGIPSLLQLSSRQLSLGSEGWWTTYLVICSMSSFLISVSLGQRHTKDIRTRGLGNCFCFLAWLSALSLVFGKLVFNRFDDDYGSQSFFGISLSSLGILAAAPILLVLEGESPSTGAGRRLLGANHQSSFHLSMPLHQKSRFLFICFCGTAFAFVATVVYETGLRGWGMLQVGSSSRLSSDSLLESLRQST